MIRYYQELEKANDFTLPLVEKSPPTSKKLFTFAIPLSFFNKYEFLFKSMEDINQFVKWVHIDRKSKELGQKNYIDENGVLDMDSYVSDGNCLSILEEYQSELSIIEDERKFINIESSNIEHSLHSCREAVVVICNLYPEKRKEWGNLIDQFTGALKELNIHSNITYGNVSKSRDVTLPNAWYITPYGDLYNTNGPSGHKEANLIYPYERIERAVLSETRLNEKGSLVYKRNQIKHDAYISELDFHIYLNYRYSSSAICNSNSYLDLKCYERRIVKTVLGIVSAKAGLYNFFENLQRYTLNTRKEFDTVIQITRDLRDILVRCAGFHKIESCLAKTITTSSINAYENFHTYLKNGWDVCVIPPIVIDRHQGIIGELDFNSPIVHKYVENNEEKYIKEKTKEYGKLYYKNRYLT